VSGESPLADQDPIRFAGLGAERATPHPTRDRNSYPNAFEQFAQLFDHPSTPDLCVVHSASHHWAEQGGHPGHHGILHNAWVDRRTGAQVVTNSPSTWATSMQWLNPV
jgi:phosphonoacetate hydrolase